MHSTGEVGCLGDDFNEALLNSLLSVGYEIPKKNILVSSGDPIQKADMLSACQLLHKKGYNIFATEGSCKYLNENGVPATRVIWPTDADNEELTSKYRPVIEMIQNKELDLVINIPKNFTHKELTNGYFVRRAAVDYNIPLITNARLAIAFIRAFTAMSQDDIQIKSWGEY
jgi:carbamoyl-phosphate synthase large subunit